jgi:ribonucleoside-diphosphate reductase alpha chain
MMGVTYGSDHSFALAAQIVRSICYAAYRISVALAKEKGSFPYFVQDRYLEGTFVRSLPDDIRTGIAEIGIRNSHLLAIAPTGTISLWPETYRAAWSLFSPSAMSAVFSRRMARPGSLH